ncbi:MAG: bifunctional metallophosphatase/5'-nucleotidase [bacterium JZ-2024 1]
MKGSRCWHRVPVAGFGVLLAFATSGLATPAFGGLDCGRARARFILASDVYKYLIEEGTRVPRYSLLVKEEMADTSSPVFHILAGDFLMPTLYGALFGGDPVLKVWHALKIDLVVPGNHEFDLPYEVLLNTVRSSQFAWLCSNCKEGGTGLSYAGMQDGLILERDGVRVGFLGIISPRLRASFSSSHHPNLEITDPIDTAAKIARRLDEAGACFVVAVTHQDISEDKLLGEMVPEISLILGGHTHTVQTTVTGSTCAFRTGSDLGYFGVATLEASEERRIKFSTTPITAAVPEDPEMKTLLLDFEARVGEVLKGDWTRLPSAQDLRASVVRTGGGMFPHAVADILRKVIGVDVVLLNAGMFRGDRVFPAGKWPLRYLYEILPFRNEVNVIQVSGETLLSALEWGLQKLPEPFGGFPVLSGAEVIYDPSLPALHRIVEVKINGKPIVKDNIYTVALPDFLRNGGDGYTMFYNSADSPSHPEGMDILVLLVEFGRSGAQIPLRSSQVFRASSSSSFTPPSRVE